MFLSDKVELNYLYFYRLYDNSINLSKDDTIQYSDNSKSNLLTNNSNSNKFKKIPRNKEINFNTFKYKRKK